MSALTRWQEEGVSLDYSEENMLIWSMNRCAVEIEVVAISYL